MKGLVSWKLFLILWVASIFSVIAVVPYVLTLQAELLKSIPIPLHKLLPMQVTLNAVIFGVSIFIGLYLARPIGLGAPILERWLEGKEVKAYLKSIFGVSLVSGILLGILIAGIDFLLPTFYSATTPPLWQRFLASFYGGIGEEVIMRLFLMTLLVWIFYKIKRTKEGRPTNIGIWMAILITAILFGLGHLPFAETLTKVTLPLMAKIITLNGIAGIVFGWLYWKKGLESAMLSHFTTDIIVHVVFPIFVRV
jgi:membrane protease YdiL (CAAX protease family)